MGLAFQPKHLVQFERARVDDQECALVSRVERALARRQIEPLPIRRDTHAVGLEHVLEAQLQYVIATVSHDFTRIGVKNGDSGKLDAAQQAAVSGSLAGDENVGMLLRVPRVRPAGIKLRFQAHAELGGQGRGPIVVLGKGRKASKSL